MMLNRNHHICIFLLFIISWRTNGQARIREFIDEQEEAKDKKEMIHPNGTIFGNDTVADEIELQLPAPNPASAPNPSSAPGPIQIVGASPLLPMEGGAAPHTLEGLRVKKVNNSSNSNGTITNDASTLAVNPKVPTAPELPLPPGALESNELPVPMEGFLRGDKQKEQIFADNSTARPTTSSAAMTTSSAMTTQQQRLPVQPEEPTGVVLPPSLPPAPVECVDVHENCPFWAKNGFCANNFYTAEMRAQLCRNSCHLC